MKNFCKNKRKWQFLFYIVFFLAGNNIACAQPVVPSLAEQVAKNWIYQKTGLERTVIQDKDGLLAPDQQEATPPYYIFNMNDGGWVIVAGDDVAYPVIGYATLGAVRDDNIPPAFSEWMQLVKEQIQAAAKSSSMQLTGSGISDKNSTAWNELTADTPPNPTTLNDTIGDVAPLVSTTWSQDKYYNTSCPTDSSGPDGHALVGCCATAIGQVMKFHNWPTTGTGSHSYTHEIYGTLSADFASTTYDWNSMPSSGQVNVYNSAVATLLNHVGISINMDYGPNGSGCSPSNIATGFGTYFKYKPVSFEWKENYTTAEWLAKMTVDLTDNRPIVYVGIGTGGHAFVCDGFQGTDHFHFNWGWNGAYDGYFYLDDLTPGGSDFSDTQGAIFAIAPDLPMCTYALSPNSGNFSSAGENSSVTVDATGSNCSWSTSDTLSWVSLAPISGTGDGTVTVSVAENTGAARSGSVTIAGKTYSITQEADSSCSFSITPTSYNFTSSEGTTTVSIAASNNSCSWSASSNLIWYALSPESGTGSEIVTVSVAENTDAARNTTVIIAGEDFQVSQDSAQQNSDSYEPDNSSNEASTIGLDTSPQTHSIVPVTDTDWVTFTLTSTTHITLQTSGALGDTSLWLYDDGLSQIDYDDDGGDGLFSKLTISNLAAGIYYAKVDDYGNDDEIGSYSLSLTTTPTNCSYTISKNSQYFTVNGGKDTITIGASSSACPWVTEETISWAAVDPTSGTGDGTVTVLVSANTGSARNGSITIAEDTYLISQDGTTPSSDSYENDDTDTAASVLNPSTPQTHSIVPATDVDWITFELTSPSSIILQTSGVTGDTRLWLYDASGTSEIAFDDDAGGGLFSQITISNLAAGIYYAKVDDYGNDDEIGSYSLLLTSNSSTSASCWTLFMPTILSAASTNMQNRVPGATCGSGLVYDCDLMCVNSATALDWIGNGWCDDGRFGMNLRCSAFNFDNGDCN